MKTTLITLAISLLAFAFIWFYKQGKNNCEKIFQGEQIQVQKETIKETRKVFQRRIASSSVTTNDNLEWLRANACQDCGNI